MMIGLTQIKVGVLEMYIHVILSCYITVLTHLYLLNVNMIDYLYSGKIVTLLGTAFFLKNGFPKKCS